MCMAWGHARTAADQDPTEKSGSGGTAVFATDKLLLSPQDPKDNELGFTQTKSDLIMSHIFYLLCFIMKIFISSIDPSEKVLIDHCLEVRVVN